jgi:hypothetical protein
MTEKPRDAAGCGQLQKAVGDKNVKLKLMQTGGKSSQKPMAIFVEILSSLKQNPEDYFGPTNAKWILVDTGITDDEDGQTWDWYMWYCPTGPPCDFLKALRSK